LWQSWFAQPVEYQTNGFLWCAGGWFFGTAQRG